MAFLHSDVLEYCVGIFHLGKCDSIRGGECLNSYKGGDYSEVLHVESLVEFMEKVGHHNWLIFDNQDIINIYE